MISLRKMCQLILTISVYKLNLQTKKQCRYVATSIALFGLLLAFPQLQGPIHHFPSLRLDFFPLSDHFKVQSTTLLHFVWTSACLYSASRSNPPHFSAPFGLSPCLTPLPSPFRHTYIRTEREARPCCCIYQ